MGGVGEFHYMMIVIFSDNRTSISEVTRRFHGFLSSHETLGLTEMFAPEGYGHTDAERIAGPQPQSVAVAPNL